MGKRGMELHGFINVTKIWIIKMKGSISNTNTLNNDLQIEIWKNAWMVS